MTDLANIAAGLMVAAADNVLPLAAFLILQVLDVITTLRFLSAGVREGNSFIAHMMDRLGYGWILLKLLVALSVVVLILFDGGASAWSLWVLNALYVVAVAWNWRQGSR